MNDMQILENLFHNNAYLYVNEIKLFDSDNVEFLKMLY